MSFKAQEIAAELADELAKRLSLAVTQGTDINGDPTILLGGSTPGAKNVFIRVKAVDNSLAKDALGLAQNVFTPHVIQFATEANYADELGGADNVADILTPTELLPVIACIAARGCAVEWYTSTYGTAPVVGTLVSANLKASFDPSVYWGVLAQQ